METHPISDFPHLTPSAQRSVQLSLAERIRHIRAGRWIGYPRAVAAVKHLEELFQWPAKQRMPNILIIGPTNNGKSMIIEKFQRQHPPVSSADQEHIPVLCVQMPAEPSSFRFHTVLLAALGSPLRPRFDESGHYGCRDG